MYSACWSLLFLCMGLIPQWYSHLWSPSSLFTSEFCKFRGYLSQLSAMLCRWLLTFACLDRCFLASSNLRLHHFSTVVQARRLILVVSLLWLILPLHMFIFVQVRSPGFIACMFSTTTSALYHTIYTLVAGGILPPLLMLFSTRWIWSSLQEKRRRRQTMTTNERKPRTEKRDIQILMMLLLQVVVFLLSNTPLMIFNLYLASTRSVTNKSLDRLAIESFLQLTTEMFVYVFPTASFYSNIFISSTFRKQFFLLLLLRRRAVDPIATRTRNNLPPVSIPH